MRVHVLKSAIVLPVRVKMPMAPALCFCRLFCTALTSRPTPALAVPALIALYTGERCSYTGTSYEASDSGILAMVARRPDARGLRRPASVRINPHLDLLPRRRRAVRRASADVRRATMDEQVAQFVDVTGATPEQARYVPGRCARLYG